MIAAACALLVTFADIGTTRVARVGNMVAAGVAILAGGTVGALLGGTTYADEALVLLSAFIADGSVPHNPVSRRWRAFAPLRLQ